MGWPAIVAALIPIAYDLLKGDDGGGDALGQAAGSEAQLLRQRQELMTQLQRLVASQAKGGRPPVFKLDLDNPQSIEDLIAGIKSPAEFNQLLKIFQASSGTGTGASQTAARLAQAASFREQDQIENIAQNLITEFLSQNKNQLSNFGPTGTGNLNPNLTSLT